MSKDMDSYFLGMFSASKRYKQQWKKNCSFFDTGLAFTTEGSARR